MESWDGEAGAVWAEDFESESDPEVEERGDEDQGIDGVVMDCCGEISVEEGVSCAGCAAAGAVEMEDFSGEAEFPW